MRAAAVAGAIWGLGGYALLWGHTPIVIHRAFVESLPGTLLLLPVRLVLWAIHGLERAAGRPFDLVDNNWWIGVAAAVVGSGVFLVCGWLAVRAVRGGRSQPGRASRSRASESERSL